ncbi:uncharacterized protein AMSG_12177 [Thecamonas trahens ATCC 50062]|uniref:HIG1 domain-containing protein n=1 Tax=Thecamonas trahens ATCC 50062 TaxID=461836 RepID=A0A0L0DK69_THETB|nr:hypothetical protein AMSG_12177 [Thecamonas trahens ATCC 50062]KNC52677.1 hypothetical protein AMSG_12177 [Thecamonas trahens ATCC 50062]|eukprot:XP_013755253.1 hypothetical protein AMSG_12177 [Thecamonas trahens ATCC 50062]
MDDYLREDTLDNKTTPFWTPLKTVGALWLATLGGTLAYQFRNNSLKLSQRVVQARVGAQAVTLGALIASAVVTVATESAAASPARGPVFPSESSKH